MLLQTAHRLFGGYAGSGKTFSMHLLRQVEESGLCWTVVAPTHKAVGVLRGALISKASIRPGTPPPSIGCSGLPKRSGAELQSRPNTALALEHLGLVLIDEASMVDSTLLGIALQCPSLQDPTGLRR